MIDVFFYFFVALALLVLAFAMKKQSPAFLGLAAVLFIIIGALFISGESLDIPSGFRFVESSGRIVGADLNYSSWTMQNISCPTGQYCQESNFVHVFGTLSFYGGFAIIVLAFLMFLRKFNKRGAEIEEM